MSPSGDIWSATIISGNGIAPGSAAGAALEGRADIMAMTQTAETAVLYPDEPGAWPHDLRLALAARIAHLNNADNLATAYREKLGGSRFADIADPTKANTHTDLAACLAFTDQVATRPSAITAADIQNLQDAGIADADIVRLTELNAFLAYQIRLDAGLALMAGASS